MPGTALRRAGKGNGVTDPARLTENLQLARNTKDDAHRAAVTAHHLNVLFAGVRLGDWDFSELFAHCIHATETPVPPWKLARRVYRAFNLGQYFLSVADVPGAWVECGTLKGFSALLLCKLAKSMDPSFTGARMHVVDSFEGLSDPGEQDAVAGRFPNARGSMACPLEHVQSVLEDFPDVTFHKGWIPETLMKLPEVPWSFVHVDVDLYEPTLGCLTYFVPRLAQGGVLVNDDYASPLFPGGGTAWDEYCERNRIAFAALDTGQAALVKDF